MVKKWSITIKKEDENSIKEQISLIKGEVLNEFLFDGEISLTVQMSDDSELDLPEYVKVYVLGD